MQARLSMLIKNGSAKLLSQPHMITLSGEKANIMVGGQIPVPISNQNGQISIEWKDYGVKLNITPDVNSEGLIQSKVKAEVSSLDWNSTHKIQLGNNMYIPQLKMTQSETAIAMSSGQTLAIGGLISSTLTEDSNKLPMLGDLPIIGNLFKSKAFSRGETELIIMVTPTIINPDEYMPSSTTEMKEAIKANPWEGDDAGGKDKGNGSR